MGTLSRGGQGVAPQGYGTCRAVPPGSALTSSCPERGHRYDQPAWRLGGLAAAARAKPAFQHHARSRGAHQPPQSTKPRSRRGGTTPCFPRWRQQRSSRPIDHGAHHGHAMRCPLGPVTPDTAPHSPARSGGRRRGTVTLPFAGFRDARSTRRDS